ncbi:MAG: hypothetical protein M0R22_02980 [Dehalococcoidia bacterium]|jgi:protein-tyrosine phosphatase|nr:hypothetical protein [Dehalococcoidia bacterium]
MNVLFVDEGDTCLGPMACGLLRSAIQHRSEETVNVDSAGLRVFDDSTSPEAVEAMKEYGIDIGDHRPKGVSHDLVQWADLILTMTGGQLREVRGAFPKSRDKSFRLSGYLGVRDEKLSDPYGSTDVAYKEVLDVLLVSLLKLAPQLGLLPESLPKSAPPPESDWPPENDILEGWDSWPPHPVTRPERVTDMSSFAASKEFSINQRWIEMGYEAEHRLRFGTFATIEEHRYLQEVVARGKHAQECWALGGQVALPENPYAEEDEEEG